MPIQKVYSQGSDPVVRNANVEDLASGQFLMLLHGLKTESDYLLSSNVIRPEDVKSDSASTLDVDFDVDILRSLTFEGEAIVAFKVGATKAGSGAQTIQGTVTLRIVRNGVETNIATATAESHAGITTTTYFTETIQFTVPKTNYRKGDILRVNATVTGGADASNTATLYHDSTTSDNEFKIYLPVRI